MKFPDDIKELLKRKFKNNHKEWLKETASEREAAPSCFLEINFDIPTEQEALRNQEGVRSWISAWNKWGSASSCGNLVWVERRWRSLGTQRVPEKLIIANANDAASWIGENARWSRAAERFLFLIQHWSSLFDVLPRYFNVLADYNDGDFNNLCEILSWLCANPNSNLYIRQVPVTDIDSKWLESRKSLVAELIAAIQDNESDDHDFYKICGLKPLPQLIRIRLLDDTLRKKFGGLGDISAPLEEIANLDFAASLTVFIVENIQTALAFDDMKNSIVLFGLGYGVDVLGKLTWLRKARCIYWGDIDTHGFAILNRARTYLPNLESILMDEAALLNHKELWVVEKDQSTSTELSNLTADEQKLFQALKNNTFGQNIRLEQERIRWDYAWKILRMF